MSEINLIMHGDSGKSVVQELMQEIERLRKYQSLVKFIANDWLELSYEKAQWQRDDWKKRCQKLLDEIEE